MQQSKGWTDYAHLASSVTQNLQLAGISDQLAELQEIQLLQAEAGDSQRRREETAIKLRAVFFQIEDSFKASESGFSSTSDPQTAKVKLFKLLRCRSHAQVWIDRVFKIAERGNTNISYEDKDRHNLLVEKIDRAISETERGISLECRVEVKKAVEYANSLSVLKEVIEYQTIQEKTKNIQALISSASPARHAMLACLVFVLWLGSASVGVLCLLMILSVGDSATQTTGVFLGLAALFSLLPLTLWVTALFRRSEDRQHLVESGKRELEALASSFESKATYGQRSTYDEMTKSFGKASAKALVELFNERVEFVNRYTGTATHEFLLPLEKH